MTYTRVTKLDDPTKPHRSVWASATGVYVKLHVNKRDLGLGHVSFEIVPSACDENGKALRRADDSVAFLLSERSRATQYRRIVKAVPDRTDDVEPFSVRLLREMMLVVARVERAVLDERDVAAL